MDFISHAVPLTVAEESALRAETNRQLPKMEAYRIVGGSRGGEQWVIYAKLLRMLEEARDAAWEAIPYLERTGLPSAREAAIRLEAAVGPRPDWPVDHAESKE